MLGRSVWEGTNWSGYDGEREGCRSGSSPGLQTAKPRSCDGNTGHAQALPSFSSSPAAPGLGGNSKAQSATLVGISRLGTRKQWIRDKGLALVNSALGLCFPLAMEGEGLQPRRGLLRGCTQKGRRAPGGEGQWLRHVGSGTNHLVQAVLSLPGNFPSSSVPRFCHL